MSVCPAHPVARLTCDCLSFPLGSYGSRLLAGVLLLECERDHLVLSSALAVGLLAGGFSSNRVTCSFLERHSLLGQRASATRPPPPLARLLATEVVHVTKSLAVVDRECVLHMSMHVQTSDTKSAVFLSGVQVHAEEGRGPRARLLVW